MDSALGHFHQSYKHENASVLGSFCGEKFDGAVQFCVAPPKSTSLLIYFVFFVKFFDFGVFVKLRTFIFRAAVAFKPNTLPARPRLRLRRPLLQYFVKLVLHIGVRRGLVGNT